MTIAPVTSLADLEFKAKTDDNYKQLAILGCGGFGYNVKLYTTAIKRLNTTSTSLSESSCSYVTREINYYRDKLSESFVITKPKKRIRKKTNKL